MNKIILFDGECNFCNRSVQFIIKRDPIGYFKFASLQSDIGKKLLKQFKVPKNYDSVILLENEKCFFNSSAALRICKKLNWPWKICYLFLLIPRPIRDSLYRIIAKNRYKWFGKKESCLLPSPEIRNRFLS